MNFVSRSSPVLYQPADTVTDVSPFLRSIKKAEELMRQSGAAGIAFPHVGIAVRIFVSRFEKLGVCVNPSYVGFGTDRTSKLEGSMIVPGMNIFVPRYDTIIATFIGTDGAQCGASLSGVESRVFQHLTDACDGRPIFPRAHDISTILQQT